MKRIIVYLLLVSCFNHTLAQQMESRELFNDLIKIVELPYNPELSGDTTFWNIAQQGLKVVPSLINLISDTTNSNIVVPNYGGFYTIGDISYTILTYIIHDMPVKDIIKSKLDYPLTEDLNYWDFVRYNYHNRIFLQEKLYDWYLKYNKKLVWISDLREYKTSKKWNFSTKQYPTKGYFIYKE